MAVSLTVVSIGAFVCGRSIVLGCLGLFLRPMREMYNLSLHIHTHSATTPHSLTLSFAAYAVGANW